MKMMLATTAVTLALAVAGTMPASADPLKVGIAAEPYPPFVSLDAAGNWVGWEIEIVNALCVEAKLD